MSSFSQVDVQFRETKPDKRNANVFHEFDVDTVEGRRRVRRRDKIPRIFPQLCVVTAMADSYLARQLGKHD